MPLCRTHIAYDARVNVDLESKSRREHICLYRLFKMQLTTLIFCEKRAIHVILSFCNAKSLYVRAERTHDVAGIKETFLWIHKIVLPFQREHDVAPVSRLICGRLKHRNTPTHTLTVTRCGNVIAYSHSWWNRWSFQPSFAVAAVMAFVCVWNNICSTSMNDEMHTHSDRVSCFEHKWMPSSHSVSNKNRRAR